MTDLSPATLDRRSTAIIGACVGLAIGSAYVAGALARASVEDAQAKLVAGSTAAPPLRGAAPLPARLAPPAPLVQAGLRGPAAPARDLECLSQAVYYEARGEEERGRRAVAQVVVNRTRQPRFPKSICGVVFQHADAGCAFSFACDGQTRRPLEPAAWRDARRIARLTLAGFAMPELRTATEFRSGDGAPAGLARVLQIGGHVFYRWSGHPAPTAAPPHAERAASAPSAPTPQAETLVKADAAVAADAPAAATPTA